MLRYLRQSIKGVTGIFLYSRAKCLFLLTIQYILSVINYLPSLPPLATSHCDRGEGTTPDAGKWIKFEFNTFNNIESFFIYILSNIT